MPPIKTRNFRKTAKQVKGLVQRSFKNVLPTAKKVANIVNKENKVISKELGFIENKVSGKVHHRVYKSPRAGYAIGEKHVFKHREYLGSLLGSTTFVYTQYPIGISSTQTFPVIGEMATKFETYRIKSLRFMFEPYASNITSSGSLGDVCMVIDYDPDNKQFTDMSQFKTYYKQKSFSPIKKRFEKFQVNPKLNPIPIKFVTHDSALNVMNDYGSFYIGCQGTQLGLLGDIYADVEVECYVMRPNQSAATQVFSLGSSTPLPVPAGVALYLGDTALDSTAMGAANYVVPSVGASLGVMVANQNSAPYIYFNGPGIYRLEVTCFMVTTSAYSGVTPTNPTAYLCSLQKDVTDITSGSTMVSAFNPTTITNVVFTFTDLVLCKTDGSAASWIQNNPSNSNYSSVSFSNAGVVTNLVTGGSTTMSFCCKLTKLPNLPVLGNASGIYTGILREINSIKKSLNDSTSYKIVLDSKDEVDSPVHVEPCHCNKLDCVNCVELNKSKLISLINPSHFRNFV